MVKSTMPPPSGGIVDFCLLFFLCHLLRWSGVRTPPSFPLENGRGLPLSEGECKGVALADNDREILGLLSAGLF